MQMTDPQEDQGDASLGVSPYPELLTVQETMLPEEIAGRFRVSLPVLRGELILLVECRAREFPFETFSRFVRHPGEGQPYTFSSMEFHEIPPGIRLGPWPGWRGIPEFPELTAWTGSGDVKLQPTFWGDEIACGILRVFGRFPGGAGGTLTIVSPDPRIVPEKVSVYKTHTLVARPHPAGLSPRLSGLHPRLLLAPEQLPLLRNRAGSSHAALWHRLIAAWNNRDLAFEKTGESKCVEGPQRLSGEDRVLISAMIALVTEEANDIQQALHAYAGFVRATNQPEFEPLGIDTQAGETLFILSVGYDWLFGWMDEGGKITARNVMDRVAGICASYMGPERRDYGQAHYLGCGLGLLAYSLVLEDAQQSAPRWLSQLRGALDCALTLLSEDGSYPHGINLWIYEFGFLLRWIELIRGCTDDDLWVSHGRALAQASLFRAATLSGAVTHGITFGDPQYRVGGDSWCHFLIASRTGSGVSQWLGEQLIDLPHEGVDFRSIPARRRVYEFLFHDPAVTPTSPGLGVRTFPDIGQVTVRSHQALCVFRAGPPLGLKRYAAGEYGAYGHSDPASGAFLIEHDGRFIACGPGPVYRRDTALHNVVTIDGQGQVGDSTVWLPDFFPPEVLSPTPDVESDGLRASVFVDLTGTYLPHLGVERCTRAMFADPERFVLGVDALVCARARSLEWNTHSRLPFKLVSEEDSFVFEFDGGVRLVVFAPQSSVWQAGLSEFIPAYPNDGTRDYRCTIKVRSDQAQFVWCYLLALQPLPRIERGRDGDVAIRFEDGLRLDFDGKLRVTEGQQ